MLEHFHLETFSAQQHTTFRIQPPCLPGVEVELVEVTDHNRPPRAAACQERFSLVFRGPHARQLQQGLYAMQHDQLGAFELFLVPVGQDTAGIYYEAVFNRLRRQDG
jgi:hypothetical protein